MNKILVVAQANNVGATYSRTVRELGADSVVASDPAPLLHILTTTPINGVIVNMPTLMRMHGEGKQRVMDLLSLFPVLRCRVDTDTEQLTVFEQNSVSPQETIANFVQTTCTEFPARITRRERRLSCHCSTLLSHSAQFPPRATERTITMNVSSLGCFCFSTMSWKPGDTAWLQFLDLDDKTPISGTVVHSTRWGKGCQLPGCGIEFTSISERQREQLVEMATAASMIPKRTFLA